MATLMTYSVEPEPEEVVLAPDSVVDSAEPLEAYYIAIGSKEIA